MILNKLLRSINKKKYKSSTIQSILSNDQKNNGIVNTHRIDKNNIGDFFCAPYHYFKELNCVELDIYDFKKESLAIRENFIDKISNNSLIIGGGGILNRGSFAKQMKLFEELSQRNKKTVIWGAGHNEKSKSSYGKVTTYNVDISKFGLVGTRDYSMPGEYVPCVSCMHQVFDNNYSETSEVGIVFHKKTITNKKVTNKFSDIPYTSNTTNLEDLISFIGANNTIITNSYHAMYWSMLLNKKVAVIPNSSKFYDFKYKPLITSFETCLNDYKKAKAYSGVLEESRELNIGFHEKVSNYLNH